MIHIGLFEGIGGFSLAAEWAGWKTLATCEINPFGQRILNHYWPGAYHHGDIHTLNYETINLELSKRFGPNWRNDDIILTGGFPCQPYSHAGNRLGKEDDRHLWPEMLRTIREIKPKYVVGENVLGLLNWNGGLVFEEVQADLENEGYEVQPVILPACGVNAPHRRERIWFVAYSNKCAERSSRESSGIVGQGSENNDVKKEWGEQAEQYNRPSNVQRDATYSESIRTGGLRNQSKEEGACNSNELSGIKCGISSNERITSDTGLLRPQEYEKQTAGIEQCNKRDDPNTNNKRLQRSEKQGSTNEMWKNGNKQPTRFFQPNWEKFPTQSPICGRNDGLPTELAGITFPKWRNESIKAYGNAIVPQVAYKIFKAINEQINKEE